MTQIFCRRLLPFLGLLLAATPLAVYGQSPGNAPGGGWGSDWTQPANEQQRQRREFNLQARKLADAHDYKGLLELCTRAIQKDPDASGLYVIRADTYSELKQYDRAAADIDHAQEMARSKHQPNASATILVDRSILDARRQDYPAAVSDLQAALKLNDKNAMAWNNLAWLRATAPDNNIRNGREGIREAQKAVALAGSGHDCLFIDTLAAAYAEADDYPQAIESEKRALGLASAQIKDAAKAKKSQEQMNAHLRLYEQRQPYREHSPTES